MRPAWRSPEVAGRGGSCDFAQDDGGSTANAMAAVL